MASLKNFIRAISPFASASHKQEKEKRRYKAEKEKVTEAQKLGLKQQQRQYDLLKDLIRGEYAPETSLKQLRKDEERALRYARDILEPEKENLLKYAQQGYERFTKPGIVAGIGGGVGGKSSALNQALAASAQDLASQVGQQYQQMQYGLAQDLLGRRELGRQQQLSSMLSVAGFPNQIAQGVAQTQIPQAPSLFNKIGPLVGAGIGGAFGGLPGAQIGYGAGQALGGIL